MYNLSLEHTQDEFRQTSALKQEDLECAHSKSNFVRIVHACSGRFVAQILRNLSLFPHDSKASALLRMGGSLLIAGQDFHNTLGVAMPADSCCAR